MKRYQLALALAFSPIIASAGTTGSISGIVTDSAGRPVADARIVMVSPSSMVAMKTDATGHYCFVSLSPDAYTLSIYKDGFNPVVLRDIVVFADVHQHIALVTTSLLSAIIHVRDFHPFGAVAPTRVSDVYGYLDGSDFPAPPVGFNGWLLTMTPGITLGFGPSVAH